MARTPRPFNLKRQTGFSAIAGFCFVLLYLPILLLVVYSFSAGSVVTSWGGFSLKWYQTAWNNDLVQEATMRSMVIAFAATAISTVVAILAALPLSRGEPFRGRLLVFTLINQPLMVPEIVTAVALLIVVAAVKRVTGYTVLGYLIAAHSAFCIPLAFMPIRARLLGMDEALEQAAADLYAKPWRSFSHITLPLLWPGILAGAMLAFVISLDDVIITEFLKSAGQETLPTYMLGQMRRQLTPEINAISTVLLAISVALVIAFFFVNRRKT